jgi:2-dehydro-3-deoxyphosphooctonate aldolase (KDO 8-P synthase)
MTLFNTDNTGAGENQPLSFILGPCVIESEDSCRRLASKLKELSEEHDFKFIFKSSYDKANRTSINSYRGPGIDSGLRILKKIREELDIPVLTDAHSIDEVYKTAEVVDVIQIPAFLCRQTDLLIAAGKTGKIVNVKKGQFLAPWDVQNIIEKIKSTGNTDIMITERGTSYGYNNLVVDFRGIPIMKKLGFPVVFDATHSVQLPGGQGKSSGGQREFAGHLAMAAVAVGVDLVFMEVHENPDQALCDGPNSIKFDDLSIIIKKLKKIDSIMKEK